MTFSLEDNEKINVLVTGATGFTGNALTKRLVDDGFCVKIIARNKSRVNPQLRSKIEVINGDITDQDVINEAVKNADIVFNIAAVFREPGISDKVYWDVHVRATELLLNSANNYGVKKFIHCSTGGVHGNIEHPPADEQYRFAPGDIYQQTKLEGEKKVMDFFHRTGLPVVIIRPAPIYGPGDMRLLKLFKMARKKYTIVLGKGEIFYHMVYIDDLVRAFILAAETDTSAGEVFIVGGNETLTLNQLLEKIANEFNHPLREIHIPAKPFQIAGSICEKICIPLGITPPLYRRRVDFFTKSRSFDISKAKLMLKYRPEVSITEGIKRTAAWYKENKLL